MENSDSTRVGGRAKGAPPARIEVSRGVTFLLGDWRSHREAIIEARPDLCLTDPPYGTGFKNMGKGRKPSSSTILSASAQKRMASLPPASACGR